MHGLKIASVEVSNFDLMDISRAHDEKPARSCFRLVEINETLS
jgi:hypothetical protein